MSKYIVTVSSSLELDDNDLEDYIEARAIEWEDDSPEEIKNLRDTGSCVLSDENGTTKIDIKKIES